jgi:hypothetical protein
MMVSILQEHLVQEYPDKAVSLSSFDVMHILDSFLSTYGKHVQDVLQFDQLNQQ